MEKSQNQKGEVIPVLMPQAGQTMEEGKIILWHVQEGDKVQKGQVLFEIETDKAAFEIEADHSGRLARIVVKEGETVPVKTPVAYLADNDADVDIFITAQASATPQKEPISEQIAQAKSVQEPTQPAKPEHIKASPAAKKLAQELGVDLSEIGTGRGPGGRIVTEDVEAKAKSKTKASKRRKMSDMRKTIGQVLTISKQTIPHFYVKQAVNAEPMLAFYQAKKAEFKCSLNDVIIMACARVLCEFPEFRSRIEGDEIVESPTVNIGIAVGTENGLLVPVISDADKMTFQQIAEESKRIVDSARAGKITGAGQAVFTITNLGMFGIDEFSAIINPPEAAILAVGAVREDAIVKDGVVCAGKVMTLTLSCDHRIVDGVLGAKFLIRLKNILEKIT